MKYNWQTLNLESKETNLRSAPKAAKFIRNFLWYHTFTCILELFWLRVRYSLCLSGVWAANNCRCLIMAYSQIFFKSWLQDSCLLGELHSLMLLTLSWWRSLSYRNQSIDLQSKSVDWFLYDRDLRHEKVNICYRHHIVTLYSDMTIPIFSEKWLYSKFHSL